jgi:hypothetical protein
MRAVRVQPIEFNGVSIMALRPKSADASDLATWIEIGADAITRKYLERLVLVIFEGDPNSADATILEEHSFSVTCPESDDNGEHQLELVSRSHSHGTKTEQKGVPGSKSAVKKECVPTADLIDIYLPFAAQRPLRYLPRLTVENLPADILNAERQSSSEH